MEAYPNIIIPQAIWRGMISELCNRGEGIRESGAFILAPLESFIVSEFVCYDDLDEECLRFGGITLSSRGFTKLWKDASDKMLHVVADIHTHPGSIVSQSWIDMENPMISFKGHVALIVPHFAQKLPENLNRIGIYEYQGDYQWRKCYGAYKRIFIK